jgi:hypothetical protein
MGFCITMDLETKVRPLAGTMSPYGYIRTESVASAVARNAMAGGFNDGCADSSFFGWNEPTLLDNAESGLGTRRGTTVLFGTDWVATKLLQTGSPKLGGSHMVPSFDIFKIDLIRDVLWQDAAESLAAARVS